MHTITKPGDHDRMQHIPFLSPPGSQAWEQLWVSGMNERAATSLSPVTPSDRLDSGFFCPVGPGSGHSSSTALVAFLPA